MPKKTLTLLLLIFTVLATQASQKFNVDSIISELNYTVDRRDTYYAHHTWRIDSIKRVLAKIPAADMKRRADLQHELFNMYRSFQGDSASVVVDRELEIAEKTGDPELIVRAKGDRIFSYLSEGAFPDAVDIVRSTSLKGVSDVAKGDFYFICQRLYSDMSVARCDNFDDKYAVASHAYADSVIQVLPATSYKSQYCSTFKTLDDLNTDEKIKIFLNLLNRTDIDNGEKAMIASIIGDHYNGRNEIEGAIYYKALSGLLDIRSSKRETTSMRSLASLMFGQGEYNLAHKYIAVALDDAEFFNAPHRKAEIANVLPLIESHRFDIVNSQRRLLW